MKNTLRFALSIFARDYGRSSMDYGLNNSAKMSNKITILFALFLSLVFVGCATQKDADAQLQGEQIISQSQHFPFLNTAKGSTFPHHSFNIKRMPICGFITRKIPHAQHSPQVEQLPRGVLVGRGGSAASSFHFHPFSFFVLFFFFNPLVP